MQKETLKLLLSLPVETQRNLCERVAANCGYKLIADVDETSIHINQIINRLEANDPAIVDDGDRNLIIKGLRLMLLLEVKYEKG